MEGLLNFLKTPAGQGLLAAGLGTVASAGRGRGLGGNLAAGGLLGMQAYTGAQDREAQMAQDAKRNELFDMQAKAYKADVDRKNQALEAEARKRAALPGLFRAPGMTGGEAVPQNLNGVPMFSQPMGVTPMQATPGGFDVMGALSAGYTPEEIDKLANIRNAGRPKATRQMEVDDGKGGKRIALVDDYGNEVAGFSGYTAPVQVNRGDRVDFVRPAPGVSLSVGMSPGERDASARGWVGLNETKRHNKFNESNAMAGRVPAGYRPKADGTLEFIPGGPADPTAAKRAAPTEFQGKAAMFGNRAAEADRIISEMTGQYSPAAVNTKLALDNAPWYLGGGVTSTVGNMAMPESAQRAEQAQRDFINAVLRLESGAAIAESEFHNARKQYFPQPGDSAQVIEQKAANRKRAIQGLMDNARTSGAGPTGNSGGATGSWDAQPSGGWSIKKVN